MQLYSNKGISKDKYVTSIIDLIIQYPKLIAPISRLFTDYNTVMIDIEEIKEYVTALFYSPKINTPREATKQVVKNIIKVYSLNSKQFNSIKSKILENIVYHIGPLTLGLTKSQVFIEPTIIDGGYKVGQSDVKCDLVFYEKTDKPLEFVECKSNIYSVIPKTLPFNDASIQLQKEIRYLNKAYDYLEQKYCKPFIYFVCYNRHVDLEKKNLQENWGFSHLSILSPENLLKMYYENKKK